MRSFFRGLFNQGSDPASHYFQRSLRVHGWEHLRASSSKSFNFNLLRRPKSQVTALALAISLAVGGVAASVAISIYGNNSNVAGQISLGVGQAVATSCDADTNIHTDTIGNYVDTYTDFVLQQVNITQLDPNCGGKLLNLVVKLNGANDVNLTCLLPASNSFGGGSTAAFSQATFAFATSSIVTNSLLYQCPNATIAVPVYLASISATALQIK
jgi:hypothetical protein